MGYRPDPGDRIFLLGRHVIDCGHPDWHAEIHPPKLVLSSFLQFDDFEPSLGFTKNVPFNLVNGWRAATNGAPATVTKVVSTPANDLDQFSFDAWPPPRPCLYAQLHSERADSDSSPQEDWSCVIGISETLEPADNPNHLHVAIQRDPQCAFTPSFEDNHALENPGDNPLRYFTAYRLWWTGECQAPGGVGNLPVPPAPGWHCAMTPAGGRHAGGGGTLLLLSSLLFALRGARRSPRGYP